MTDSTLMQERADEFRKAYGRVHREIAKVIVGHSDVVHGVLTCLFVGGHALLEGVPGLGKTLLVRTLSQVLDLKFKRIQFTPDLMPSDIIGTNIINETAEGKRVFTFQPGAPMPSITLPGVSIKGASRVQFEEAATAAQSDAQSALSQEKVPRAYQGAVKDYFDDRKK